MLLVVILCRDLKHNKWSNLLITIIFKKKAQTAQATHSDGTLTSASASTAVAATA